MDKQQAAEKLKELFHGFNMIGVIHSVAVEVSKYIIIFLLLFYTWHCFTVFLRRNQEKKEKIYKKQVTITFTIHFICHLVLFLNSLDIRVVAYYLIQVVILSFLTYAYPYVFENISTLVLNNMTMLLSIGMIMSERLDMNHCIRQMIFIGVMEVAGLFIPWIIEKVKILDRLGWFYAVLGIISLAAVFVIGKTVFGAKNWIIIGGFAMQPSEFVKIIYVFFAASLLAKSTEFYDVVKVSVVAALHVLILVGEKDLGAALIFYITYLFILYVASEKVLYLIGGALAGAAAAVVAYLLFSHVQIRVTAWLDPWGTIDKQGYQITQSLFAIGTGGWFGLGLGEGAPTTIPVAESDFILSAICEELGTCFGICIILIELSCFIMFINIALKMEKPFYKLTALGLAVEFLFQNFLTIGGAIKFIPSTGVTLPLVSYGGSSVISTMILFSIIQGMYVMNQEGGRSDEIEEKQKER